MKYLNGNYFVEVKDKQYNFLPEENIILWLRDPPKALQTQNQVQHETQTGKN